MSDIQDRLRSVERKMKALADFYGMKGVPLTTMSRALDALRDALEQNEAIRSSLSTARAEGIREGLDETWLAEMIYSHALGCDPAGKTVKADGEPYGMWKKAVDAAAAIRAKIEEPSA